MFFQIFWNRLTHALLNRLVVLGVAGEVRSQLSHYGYLPAMFIAKTLIATHLADDVAGKLALSAWVFNLDGMMVVAVSVGNQGRTGSLVIGARRGVVLGN